MTCDDGNSVVEYALAGSYFNCFMTSLDTDSNLEFEKVITQVK